MGNNSKIRKVTLPASKSILSRALILSFIAGHFTTDTFKTIEGDCEDVINLQNVLSSLQQHLADSHSEICRVRIEEGAAPMRFFTALAASIPGTNVEISVGPTLSRRPIDELLNPLRLAGADISVSHSGGEMKLHIRGRQLKGGTVKVDSGVSSQFVSSLMMVSPLWEGETVLDLGERPPVSAAYIGLTLDMMRRYGVTPLSESNRIIISPREYSEPVITATEPDWSAAAFFYEQALLDPDTVIRFMNLRDHRDSIQGDAFCAGVYDALGVTTIYCSDGEATLTVAPGVTKAIASSSTTVNLDLSATPDLVPSLVVALAMSGIRFRFTGIGHLRHKESNRIEALTSEIRKLGIVLNAGDSDISWSGEVCEREESPEIDPHSDHRIAMAFAAVSKKDPSVKILNPEVVTKSFPSFWSM